MINFIESQAVAQRGCKRVVRASLVALTLALSGCGSLLSSAGPSRHAISAEADSGGYSVIDLTAQTIRPYMRPPERPTVPTVALPEVPEVRLVPGDVLKIVISDSATDGALFAPLATGGTVFSNVRLDNKGRISLPYVGRPVVTGKTLSEVEDQLRKSLRDLRITTEPQVQVELAGDLSGSVLVAGAVKAPGRFSALQGPLTLLDAINRAGGPVLEPHLIRAIVRTGSASYEFNYEDLLAGKNQVVPPNSEIVLERARKRYVAMGAVGEPGLHDFPSNNPSLLEVLGQVGGLNEAKADSAGVFIFRLTDAPGQEGGGDGQIPPTAEVFRLNLKDPAAMFLAQQFLIRPEDAIYVTNAAVYEWQKIISPIVQVLVLGRAVNGF